MNDRKYARPYNKHYKVNKRREIAKNECRMLWTAMWLLFVLCLCFLFDTTAPLWLLVVWFLGLGLF